MVAFIGIADMQKHLQTTPVHLAILRMAEMIEEDYKRWHLFDKSARVANHSNVGVIELMPISDALSYSFKYVNGHPKNTAEGLLTVTAFGVLADVDTGYPRLLSELTITTALRTAATSVLFAGHLARKNSKSMALIGNGAQSEFQAIAFHKILGINELHIFDVDAAASDKLAQNLLAFPELKVRRFNSTAEAVKGVDIVTTVTADKTNALILTSEMVEPGMHINAVGGDCPGKTELHADILHKAKVVVEFEAQSRIEGELQQMPADFQVTEFWQLVSDKEAKKPIRTSDTDITVFDSVGFALEDFSALRYLEKYVLPEKIRHLDLVPNMSNPKNLFGLAMQSGSDTETANKLMQQVIAKSAQNA